MERRRKPELLLEDFRRLLADRRRPERDQAFPSAVRNLAKFEEALARDPAKLRQLTEFALSCFVFRRPRDSFGGRRRAMAFDILSKIASFIDLPEAVEMVRASSGKARSVEARHAAAFLEEDFRERDLCPDEATTEELLALAERTDRRSTTSRRWDYSSKPGQSASWRQLNRLDEWKGEHFRGSRSC